MRQIYVGFFLFLGLISFLVVLSFFWVNRPITCLPDCTSMALTNRRLQNYDLSNAIMVEANLRNSDLRNANLSGADFSGADLINVNLSNANLTGTRFIGANMIGVDLRNTVLADTDFTGADLSRANLTRTDLREARLGGIVLNHARLVEVNVADVDLPGTLSNFVDWTGSQLSNIVLAGSAMSNANLSGAVLKQADLRGSWLNLANLSGTDLSGANLAGSSLIASDLSSANLTGSSMVGAVAIGADFSGATLNGTNMTGVRLFRFEIEPTDLVSDPFLQELNELQRSQRIVDANLSGVAFDEETLWPTGKRALLQNILGTHIAEGNLLSTAPHDNALGEGLTNPIVDAKMSPAQATGDITVVGSSDVLTLTQYIATEFREQGFANTITLESVEDIEAFERLCQPESGVDILNANRSIRDAELAVCAAIGRLPVRFRIATDAIAMVVNPSNEFITDVTLEDLAKIVTAERWNEVNAAWPTTPIVRYIPAGDSASKDLFLRTVFGSDTDNTVTMNILSGVPGSVTSETDDDVILGVARDPNGIGFLPVTAYEQNTDILKILTIKGVELNAETVEAGEYALSRPLLIYTDSATLRDKPQVVSFLNFYLTNVRRLNNLTSYFISSDLVLNQARTTLREAAAPVPTDTIAITDTLTQEIDLAEIFTVPNPLIPLAPISPTLGLNQPAVPDETQLTDLEGPIQVIGNALVLSPTEVIAGGFQGLGFSQPISLTHVTIDQAFTFFCESDQIDLVAVSRSIEDNEIGDCRDNGRTPLPFRIGTDVIAIVTNANNDFARDITTEELALLFSARTWSDANPDWPAEPIQRFTPPLNSSVSNLFVEQVLTEEADQLLLSSNLIPVDNRGRQAQAIATNPYAIGFMEYPAYQRNTGLLNLVAVNGVFPDTTTIEDDSYPLLRPLLLYASARTLVDKPQVAAFLNFYLTNAAVALEPLNYVPASGQDLDDARTTLRQAVNPPEPTPTREAFATPVPLSTSVPTPAP